MRNIVILMAMVEGVGALSTYYYTRYIPFECQNAFTCQTPPTWLDLGMLISFGLGIVIPAIGVAYAVYTMLHKSAGETTKKNNILNLALRVIAFSSLLATGVSLFMLQSSYIGFFIVCSFGPAMPGLDCGSFFANALALRWAIVALVSSILAAVFGVLSSSSSTVNEGRRIIDSPVEKIRN